MSMERTVVLSCLYMLWKSKVGALERLYIKWFKNY